MKSRLCFLLFLGTLILGICNGAPVSSTQEEARKFVEEASKSYYAFYDKLIDETIQLESGDIGAFFSALDTILTKTDAVASISRNASEYAETKYDDQELNYILEKLKKSGEEAILGGERFFQLVAAVGNLEELAIDKDISAYKNESVDLAYYPDIHNILIKSSDEQELKYYWNAWREKNAKWGLNNFMVFVTAMKDAADLTGISGYDFWMRDFNMTQMDQVMEQLGPFYRQMHAFLRYHLNKKYGDSVVNIKGLIPDHLFQQVLAQIWTEGSVIEELFPHEELPKYDEELVKQNYDTAKLFKTADKFFETMGFSKIPEEDWGKKLKMKDDEDEGDCKPLILAETNKVFMHYCHKMDYRTFMQAHGYMAEIHLALEKPSDMPSYYIDSYDLEYAIGEAAILSASSPKYLAKVGLLPTSVYNEHVFMNRLLRSSMHYMLSIPVYYVHTKVMADMFGGKFDISELNKKYWEMMDKYVGVGPPMDRVENTFDFPFKFYLDLNENQPARKFMAEVLGFQIYEKMCTVAGEMPKGKIQNCDFSDSKAVGDVFKKMIKLGSSKPYREVLATLLPENPRLDANALLEYYFPSLNFIVVANRDLKVHPGWEHSDKKVESVKVPDSDD